MIVPQIFSLCPGLHAAGLFQTLPVIQDSPDVRNGPDQCSLLGGVRFSLSLALLLTEHQHVLGSACTWSQPQMASKATIFFNLVLNCSLKNFINLQGAAGIVGGAASPLMTTLQKLIFSPGCVLTKPGCLPVLPYLCSVYFKIIWRLAQGCIYFRVFFLAASVYYHAPMWTKLQSRNNFCTEFLWPQFLCGFHLAEVISSRSLSLSFWCKLKYTL